MMMLYCFVQNYHWGKKGNKSVVAKLASGNSSDFKIDENTPYAELWMGAHPNGPSVIMDNGLLLNDWIKKNSHSIGKEVYKRFQQLPFLLKVLSVDTALSIQVHPTKSLAEKLHSEKPDIYRDPNHKPEMAIALTPFEALCGFRPINEIKSYLRDISEFETLIGEELIAELFTTDDTNYQPSLRKCFYALMTASVEKVTEAIESLLLFFSSVDKTARESIYSDLIIRLHSQYPGDVGVFCIYFFNYIVLKPGDVIFLAANEPHAYISGDCVECMACSDNVVRCGLTPKSKDIDTLCEMLTYNCEPPSAKFFNGFLEDKFSLLYRPPVEDFAVAKIFIPNNEMHILTVRKSASICIVIQGKAKINNNNVQKGSVFFLAANHVARVEVTMPQFLMFQAMANL